MTGQPIMECRFCPRDDLTPQGHKSHETHCDGNPNPGIPYDKQEEMGILDDSENEGTTSPEGATNPYQEASEPSDDGLPSVETLSPDKSGSARADGGTPEKCPLCGSDDVLPADEAKAAYIDAAETANGKAVLGYDLADWACTAPECSALWGAEYDEPLTMSEVVNA